MAIKPTFASFQLPKLRALLGCRKADLIGDIMFNVRASRTITDETQRKAKEITTGLISGQVNNATMDVEDEAFQHVIIAMAQLDPAFKKSESLFWEEFLNRVEKMSPALRGDADDVLKFFFEGRPLVGKSIKSPFVLYGYLTNEDVGVLCEFIEDNEKKFKKSYEFKEAWDWLLQLEAYGHDLFFYRN